MIFILEQNKINNYKKRPLNLFTEVIIKLNNSQ